MTSAMSVPVYELPTVPVVQPPHLEGDASLATEILPGPPSLTAVRQSGLAHRRDPKKPGVSYLPASDPGTTYSGHSVAAMTSALETDGAPKRKRARVDKGSAANRAQRASARNVNAAPSFSSDAALGAKSAPSSPPLVPDSDSASVQMDAEPLPPLSRSNSLLNVDETVANGKGGKREKGKGKEKEKAGLRVKEEPVNVALPPADQAPNEDHCSSCRSLGALVYCDGCPRAFHLWCLNPPMEPGDLPEGDARWFCPNCSIRQNPPPQPPPSVLAPVIQQVQTSIPIEFQLPDDIRGFFKDVASNARGGYVDASEIKQPRLNRHGQLEDRDPYRLKDRNGAPVLCFRCGMSALPDDAAAHSPAVKRARKLSGADCKAGVWKSIVSCDYCDLHFHLDCLDPPLPSMPSFGKKWMCPNHAEHVIQPKRRIPKHNAPPIDISRPNQWNNGNIEIIQSEPVSAVPKVSVDEVMINGRRYRVPEKVVVLDFWNKVKNHGQHRREFEIPSTASSPLTTLSELDMDDTASSHPNTAQPDEEDIRIAELLCGLRVTAPQAGQGSFTVEKHDAGSSAVNGNAGDASKRRRTAGPSHKAAAEKPPAPRRTERRNARASAPSNVNELPKLEQDDTDYLPTAGPSKAQHAPAPQKTSPEDGEGSARPRRSGRVPQPRRKSPIPTRLASRESFTATSEGKPTPSEKPLAKSTPPAPPAAPPSMPTSSISENPQPQPPNSQSLKIRLPRLNAIGLSSNPAPPSVSAPLSQPSTINSAGRPERHKAPASESRARRSSRRRTSTAASAAGSPSPSKLSSRNIAV